MKVLELFAGTRSIGKAFEARGHEVFSIEWDNRVCSDGTRNVCSMLYGACCRIAKEMGYRRVITYTLASEDGASLKASNFICEGTAGGTHWTGSRDRGQDIPAEMKKRWLKRL